MATYYVTPIQLQQKIFQTHHPHYELNPSALLSNSETVDANRIYGYNPNLDLHHNSYRATEVVSLPGHKVPYPIPYPVNVPQPYPIIQRIPIPVPVNNPLPQIKPVAFPIPKPFFIPFPVFRPVVFIERKFPFARFLKDRLFKVG